MKSRVLFVDHVGAMGGGELVLVDMATAYRETSTVLLFADGPLRDRLTERGVQVEVIPGSRALHGTTRATRRPGLRAGFDAIRLAARAVPLARRHDCLYANSQKAFVIACLTGAIARRPVIWDMNDLLTPDHFSAFNIGVDVLLANHCARGVLANSHASAQALIARGGRVDKIRVVHDGIDAAPFDAVTDAQVAEARQEFGVTGKSVVGLFGRLAEWKGQRVALEAMRRLPGIHLLVVGDALFGETAYADGLRRDAAVLGLSDRVHFTGFRRDIPRLMRMVDIVVHTSTAPEPFGLVIVEGMLARRPVVATRGGGVEEIIASGINGVVVAPGDAGELASVLERLVGDPDMRMRLGDAGRQNAVTRFGLPAMLHNMHEQLERMLQT
jgi:glycosyltransferase involved in cell wall biosynthesis